MAKKNVLEMLQMFQSIGAYHETPLYSVEQLSGLETELKVALPQDFKTFTSSGSVDTANFNVQLPHRFSRNGNYIIFARWNDELFAFKEAHPGVLDQTVYVMEEESHPEIAFNDFIGYLQAVYFAERNSKNPE